MVEIAHNKSTREMSERHRERIRTSAIIKRLNDHVEEKNVMTSTQVKAAEILLKKTLPDLKQIEHSGNIDASLTINIIKPS